MHALRRAAGLQVLATGGTLDLDDAGRSRARKFADTVRQLIVDPIYAAIEAHRAPQRPAGHGLAPWS